MGEMQEQKYNICVIQASPVTVGIIHSVQQNTAEAGRVIRGICIIINNGSRHETQNLEI